MKPRLKQKHSKTSSFIIFPVKFFAFKIKELPVDVGHFKYSLRSASPTYNLSLLTRDLYPAGANNFDRLHATSTRKSWQNTWLSWLSTQLRSPRLTKNLKYGGVGWWSFPFWARQKAFRHIFRNLLLLVLGIVLKEQWTKNSSISNAHRSLRWLETTGFHQRGRAGVLSWCSSLPKRTKSNTGWGWHRSMHPR